LTDILLQAGETVTHWPHVHGLVTSAGVSLCESHRFAHGPIKWLRQDCATLINDGQLSFEFIFGLIKNFCKPKLPYRCA